MGEEKQEFATQIAKLMQQSWQRRSELRTLSARYNRLWNEIDGSRRCPCGAHQRVLLGMTAAQQSMYYLELVKGPANEAFEYS
ncbi:hypothetical protein C7H84_35825 [Burkholderia sp. Nafp2/4-1b]|nr:hypothetical protein C7H84_35825 [Burkholderia sp. Nafp2/4-1b]